jgi:hypothetical protein
MALSALRAWMEPGIDLDHPPEAALCLLRTAGALAGHRKVVETGCLATRSRLEYTFEVKSRESEVVRPHRPDRHVVMDGHMTVARVR